MQREAAIGAFFLSFVRSVCFDNFIRFSNERSSQVSRETESAVPPSFHWSADLGPIGTEKERISSPLPDITSISLSISSDGTFAQLTERFSWPRCSSSLLHVSFPAALSGQCLSTSSDRWNLPLRYGEASFECLLSFDPRPLADLLRQVQMMSMHRYPSVLSPSVVFSDFILISQVERSCEIRRRDRSSL